MTFRCLGDKKQEPGNYFFYTHCISHGLTLTLKLLDRIDQLETGLTNAQARLGTGRHTER